MTKRPPCFSWVIPKRVAAMAYPAALRSELEYLKDRGIGLIVSLTENELPRCLLDEFSFEYVHIPVADFAPPAVQQIDEFIQAVDWALENDRAVVVHCTAGKGRTGTMLACLLVYLGNPADKAINIIRRKRPGSVETVEQGNAVRAYEEHVRG